MKLILLLIYTSLSFTQSALRHYISIAIKNNLELKQKSLSFQQSSLELGKVKSLFFPSIDINARYTKSGGGREINLPLGDLLNPLYGLHGISQIQNQSINFLRKKEHETTISLTQHVFNLKIYQHYKLKNHQKDAIKHEKFAFKKEVILKVKKAYFNIIKLNHIKSVLVSNKSVLEENKRVTQSLFSNDKITQDAVYQSEVSLLELKREQNKISNQSTISKKYLNHLLNRSLDSEIKLDKFLQFKFPNKSLEQLRTDALNSRHELKQLTSAIISAGIGEEIAKAEFYPNMLLNAQYGFQGETYNFDKEHDFWMVSGILQWNLFKGFYDSNSEEIAELEIQKYQTIFDNIKSSILLQVEESYYNLKTGLESISISELSLKNSIEAFRIIQKKYNEGLISYVDYLNSLTQKRNQKITLILSKIAFQIQYAELEYATGKVLE